MAGESRFSVYAVALLLVAGLLIVPLLFVVGPPPAIEQPRPAVETPETPPESPDVAAPPMELAPPEMVEAVTTLEAQYAERRAELPAEVSKPIDDDIGVIEGIAADLLAALADEPDNEDLKRMLVMTYRNEVKLLKKALHLSSAEDDEVFSESEPAEAPVN